MRPHLLYKNYEQLRNLTVEELIFPRDAYLKWIPKPSGQP